jgi:hypothetical protein
LVSKTYYRRKAQGLCVRCGEQADLPKVNCGPCLVKIRAEQAAKYKRLKDNNQCVTCALPALEEKLYCPIGYAKDNPVTCESAADYLKRRGMLPMKRIA